MQSDHDCESSIALDFDDNDLNENTRRPYNLYFMTAQPRGTETNTKLEKYFNHTNLLIQGSAASLVPVLKWRNGVLKNI